MSALKNIMIGIGKGLLWALLDSSTEDEASEREWFDNQTHTTIYIDESGNTHYTYKEDTVPVTIKSR